MEKNDDNKVKQCCSAPRCYNLLQNPSFETGLTCWEVNNVIPADNMPFEGTQVARLETGVASMFQDVSLANLGRRPLFLSFNVVPGSDRDFNGDLVAEVLWLDESRNTVATGLRLFIPNGRINTDARVTYFDITDRPPANAVWARLQFSKGLGAATTDTIALDQVILSPVKTINLVQNSGFELGLTNWDETNSIPTFIISHEGTGSALMSSGPATLFQDVPIADLPVNSSFLLSFAARSFIEDANLSVQVQWLDSPLILVGLE